MSIRFTKYVDITSGVGAGSSVRLRDLIGRIFTDNVLIPPNSLVDFSSADEVGTYFGTSSAEYARALFYFGWISKSISKPTKITYARWNENAVAPRIFGGIKQHALSTFTAISDGSFVLTLGATTHPITALDFTAASTLADVAGIIQTKIRLQSGAMWTSATVTYNSSRSSFDLTGGLTGDAVIAVAAHTTGTNILTSSFLSWGADAILSDGADAQTSLEAITASASASNNFGSFLFMDALSLSEVEDIAAWNSTQNVLFQFMVPVLFDDASDYYDALKNYSGVVMTETAVSGEYPEMVPMMILAATRYSRPNSVQNYMFQQFNLTPTVTTDSKSDLLDSKRVNYYGRTQTAGQQIDFYQRGVMTGTASAPVDINVYANEQWLKDDMGANIMTLLLSLPKISANTQGRSQIIPVIQDTVDRALLNGTISVGKALTTVQKLYIDTVTNDSNAWYQVQTIGYWLDCLIESYVTVDSRTEYKATYTLVYSKDDAIRKVEGTHILI